MTSLNLAIILAVALCDGLVLGYYFNHRAVTRLRAQLAAARVEVDRLEGRTAVPPLRLVSGDEPDGAA
jgi:hypothetical protein